MSSSVAIYSLTDDAPLHYLTIGQLKNLVSDAVEKCLAASPMQQPTPRRWYVNTMSELAKILGTSTATLYRMKKDGILDDCISQAGRWMMIDVDAVVEKFRLSGRKTIIRESSAKSRRRN